MAYFADELVIYACTEITKAGEDNTIAPFIKYLEEGQEFTPTLRTWLIGLLKSDGFNKHSLKYTKGPGRRTSLEEFEEQEFIYKRVADFDGLIITRELCEEFIEHTGMSGGPDHYDKEIYRFGWMKHTTTGGFPDSYIDETVTLKVGKMLNTDQIFKIVAAESGTSLSTVKRVMSFRQGLSYPEQ
jgi:hypothetical protein